MGRRVQVTLAGLLIALGLATAACTPVKPQNGAGGPANGPAQCAPEPGQECLLAVVTVYERDAADDQVVAVPNEMTFPVQVIITVDDIDGQPIRDRFLDFSYPVNLSIAVNPWQAPITWDAGEISGLTVFARIPSGLAGYSVECELRRDGDGTVMTQAKSITVPTDTIGGRSTSALCKWPEAPGEPIDPHDKGY